MSARKKIDSFGGNWTIEKLEILKKYLDFYTKALKNKPFKKIYIDALAGQGSKEQDTPLFESEDLNSMDQMKSASTYNALSLDIIFDEYYFIDRDAANCANLRNMLETDFPHLKDKVVIIQEDTNICLPKLIGNINWLNTRGVIFIDPYSNEVKWKTVQELAASKLDIWYLFPLGVSTLRLLRKDRSRIPVGHIQILDELLGTNEWFDEFYKSTNNLTLFGDDHEVIRRDAGASEVKEFILKRLRTVFPEVTNKPRVLYNSKNNPLYLFIYAMANESPAARKLGKKVAEYILSKG